MYLSADNPVWSDENRWDALVGGRLAERLANRGEGGPPRDQIVDEVGSSYRAPQPSPDSEQNPAVSEEREGSGNDQRRAGESPSYTGHDRIAESCEVQGQ